MDKCDLDMDNNLLIPLLIYDAITHPCPDFNDGLVKLALHVYDYLCVP